MKKILLNAIALLLLLGNVNAAESKGEFFVGIGANKSDNLSTIDGSLGYGFTKYWDNGILAGTSIYFGGSGSDELFYGVDGRVGYSYKDSGVYTIASGVGQTLGGSGANSTGGNTSYGFGGGAGIEYKFDKWTISGEYKTYSMTSGTVNIPDYTLTIENLLLKYRF